MRAKFLTALVVIMLTAAACAGSANNTGPNKAGGTVIIGAPNDASVSNPDISTDYPDAAVGCNVYEGLTVSRLDGGVDPLLARSWTISSDGLTFTFKLVTTNWTDGQPFTSDDVVYSLMQVAAKYSASFAGAASDIVSLNAPDAHTVVIQLRQPFGPFLNALACDSGAAILPKHLFANTDVAKNPASLQHPVGTGPFMMSEWVAGDHITLVKNPHYWMAGKPYIDKLIYQVIPSSSSMVLSLLSGEVQYVDPDQISQTDYPTIKANSSLQLNEDLFPASDDILTFNVRGNRPTANVQVRHALAMAIDRNFLLKSLYSGSGNVGVEPFDTRLKWLVDPKVNFSTMYPFDINKANSILDSAGFPKGANGVRFTLTYVVSSSHPPYVAAGQAMQQWFGQIGVNLKIESQDDQSALTRVFTDGNFDMAIEPYTTRNDPALGIVRQFTTSRIGKVYGDGSGYSNLQVDQLAVQGQSQATHAARVPYYNQLQEIIANDLPVMLILQRIDFDASSRRLQGIWNGHEGYGDWASATIQH